MFQRRNALQTPCFKGEMYSSHFLRPENNVLVGSFALRALQEPKPWRVVQCCLTLPVVFQVHVWKTSKGNCNSHLPFCLLLDKQEKYNNNNGGESSLSSLFKCVSCCGLNDTWDHSWLPSSAGMVYGVTCMESVKLSLISRLKRLHSDFFLGMILGTCAPFACAWKLFWRVPVNPGKKIFQEPHRCWRTHTKDCSLVLRLPLHTELCVTRPEENTPIV